MKRKPLILFPCPLPLEPSAAEWKRLKSLARIEISPGGRALSANPRLSEATGLVSLISEKIDAAFFRRAPRLKVVANYGVGFNNIDLIEATQRGISVCNTPDVLTNATAELAIGLIFAAARRFKEGTEILRAGKAADWGPSFLLGEELEGATLGIIGPGRIGLATAMKARVLGMQVLATARAGASRSRVLRDNALKAQSARMSSIELVSLKELLQRSDFVSIHCPLNASTRGLIGPAELKLMKPSAYLINTARGEIVDEKALITALNQNRLRGAALDVFWHEPRLAAALRKHPRAFVLPHLGSATAVARSKMARLALRAVIEVLSGRVPRNQVN